MSALGTSPFAFERLQSAHALTSSPTVRDRGIGPVASWLRSALSILRTALPLSPVQTSQGHDAETAVTVRDIAATAPALRNMTSAPCCRMCGTRGTRLVCATCATKGFIELRCGCVDRPDGSRYSCDAAIERWLDAPLACGAGYSPCVQGAFDAWANTASAERGVVSTSHVIDANRQERLWLQR